MSDIRFIIIGAGLIFAGIIVLSVFGSVFVEIAMQAEFGECYKATHGDYPCDVCKDIDAQDVCEGSMFGHCCESTRNFGNAGLQHMY